jgi:nucleotide-binding universal stress UspA family protein
VIERARVSTDAHVQVPTDSGATGGDYVRRMAPFDLIVCGIDGSPAALEGARQAAALAGPDSTIELVAVTTGRDGARLFGADGRAGDALARARAELGSTPARVIARTVAGISPTYALQAEAADADLLVVGRHGWSRLGGLLVGSTASTLLRHSSIPVLLAVRPPEGVSFPDRILVAADGPDHPEDAVALAASIAELQESEVTLFRVDWSHRAKRPALAEAVAVLRERTGEDPVEILVGGSAHRLIPEYAREHDASLVITGSRGLTGVGALRSVSERVAHQSPCSVLVIHGSS